jgi:hypothetical protein
MGSDPLLAGEGQTPLGIGSYLGVDCCPIKIRSRPLGIPSEVIRPLGGVFLKARICGDGGVIGGEPPCNRLRAR